MVFSSIYDYNVDSPDGPLVDMQSGNVAFGFFLKKLGFHC